MTCNCTHGCTGNAEGSGRYPALCDVCGLTVALNGSKCGLPYVPTAWKPLEPEVVMTREQADKAIDTAMEGLI